MKNLTKLTALTLTAALALTACGSSAAATAPAVWVWPVPSCCPICCSMGPESWEKMSSVMLMAGPWRNRGSRRCEWPAGYGAGR